MEKKSLKLNFIMNVILTMSAFIFPLITFPYISRILLPEGTGKVSFAISIINYFVLFAQLGIPTYGIRACAKVRDNREDLSRVTQELLFINMVMSIISYIIFFIVLFSVPRLHEEKTLLIIVSFTIVFNTIGVEWLYRALEEYSYITIRSLIFKVIALIMMFLLIQQQSDYIIYAAISIFAACSSSVLNFVNMYKYVDLKPVGNYKVKKHLKPVLIFFAMTCAATIYTNLDTVMLGFMKSDIDVGYYNAAVKIKAILVSIVTSLGVVLLPRVSYYIEHGLREEFLRVTKKAINFVFIVSIPLMLYFILFAKEGILFLSGAAYKGAIIPMQIIMPTLLFIGLTNVMGVQMLVPLGKERIVLYSTLVGAIVNLVINIILIPKMASIGAAIGTLVAEIVVWIIQHRTLKDVIKNAYRQIKYIPISIGLILGSIGALWIKILDIGNFLKLVISSIIFFGIYVVVLIVLKEPFILEIEHQVLGKLIKNRE